MKRYCPLSMLISPVFLLLALATKFYGCTPVHPVQTAVEIVRDADAILLVRVPDVIVGDISPLEMSILEVLKGNFGGNKIIVHGQTLYYSGSNEHPVPYNFVRLGGRWGNCFADDYRAGGEFLLFLKKGDLHWSPLAAVNEEVWGPNDPWVVWVRKYLQTHR